MKKWFVKMIAGAAGLMLATTGFTGELSQHAASKLDAKLRLLLTQGQLGTALAKNNSAAVAENGASVQVLIKTTGTMAELRARGAQIMASTGDIATAVLPVAALAEIASLNEVIFIESSKTYKFRNDAGRVLTRATDVHAQFNFTGKGVIVGVLDTGVDWRHEDFRKTNGQTRIKYLLDFSVPGDTNGDGRLEGSGPYGGTLYSEAQINAALNGPSTVTAADRNGHGTHVTGSAAGNGRGTSNGIAAGTYAGTAPEADIIFVKSRNGDIGNIPDIDALNAAVFIDSVAKALGQPYVINLSFGGHEGAHDGTSLQEQAFDNLVGAGKKGKAIVVAAGNEGQDNIHAGGSISSSITIDFNVPTYTASAGAQNDFVLFEGWYPGNINLSYRLTAPNGTNYGPVASGGNIGQDTPNGAIVIDNAGTANPLNNSKQVVIQIFDNTANNKPAAGNWKLTITGNTNRYDLWLHSSTMSAVLTTNASASRLVAIPGTAKNVITVGAWVSKKSWTDLDNNPLSVPSAVVNTAAGFSSPGPSRDGRVKPEISAPGQMIGSTLSNEARPGGPYSIWNSPISNSPNAFILRDNRHAIGNGTSFAAPLVAGGIALMLQSNPNLDAVQIRKALTTTAKTDGFTGAVPNDQWGYGKADFLAALNYVTSVEEDPGSSTPPQAFSLLANYPNPFNPETQIAYEIPLAARVEIAVFDMLGRQVRTLLADQATAGRHQIIWDGRNDQGQLLTSGVYVYQMRAGDFAASKKMVLLR